MVEHNKKLFQQVFKPFNIPQDLVFSNFVIIILCDFLTLSFSPSNLPFQGWVAWESHNTTMSLNCLTCGNILQRVKSNNDDACLPPPEESTKPYDNFQTNPNNNNRKVSSTHNRSWSSGNITPPQFPHSGPLAKVKAEHHRRTNSEGGVGPRLIRSSGMRRDWSFEDLSAQQKDKGVRCYWDFNIYLSLFMSQFLVSLFDIYTLCIHNLLCCSLEEIIACMHDLCMHDRHVVL